MKQRLRRVFVFRGDAIRGKGVNGQRTCNSIGVLLTVGAVKIVYQQVTRLFVRLTKNNKLFIFTCVSHSYQMPYLDYFKYVFFSIILKRIPTYLAKRILIC